MNCPNSDYLVHVANSLPALEARVKVLEETLGKLACILAPENPLANDMGTVARAALKGKK